MTNPAATRSSFVRVPGVVAMFAVSIVARLPLATFSVGVLIHVQHLTGSFAAAGIVSGALATAQGVGGPLLGRAVDRRGQGTVLVASSLVAAGALGLLALRPPGTSVGVLAALAAAVGFATPPVGACLRTLLAEVVADSDGLRRAYALDAATTELTWVAGPPLVLTAVALWDSRVALLGVGALLVSATVLFAALPAPRRWRPSLTTSRPAGGALSAPGMRTLVFVLIGVGVLFGATEVAVTAATDTLGRTAAAGPVLGLWGVGSFIGGVAATRLGAGARTARGLALLLGALGAGHLALGVCTGSVVTLGVVIAVAGTPIAPILAGTYAMVDDLAPPGTATEAFAWIATATAIGTSAGAATAGAMADAVGPDAAFAVAGTAAVVAALLTIGRRHSLPAGPTAPVGPGRAAPASMTDLVTA